MATAIKKPAISGPGLKKQGVVVLQSFFIFIFVWLEMWIRGGAGILSGLIICLVTYGGIAYGRTGTRYVAAVTPPLAYAATTLIYTIFSDGLRPSRVGIDFIASLASVAPFLLISALYGWFMFFNERAKSRPSQRLQATPEVR
ncbi:hypothetical protein [Candidatus Planktophila dulcis]|uniref:hypothetical protein n=1 Tax=Candidatus Planktophila dulcis TaxID=1884914 RepID=UPI003CF2D3EF